MRLTAHNRMGMRRAISCWSAKVVITLGIGLGWTVSNAQWCIADSYRDFSDVQGQAGWYYGYYDRDGDPDRTYHAATDFQLLPQFDPSDDIVGWHIRWGEGGFWTHVGREIMHPNGRTTGLGRQSREHWAIRRWVSPVQGSYTLRVRLDEHTCCGDGTVARVYVNGVEVWSFVVPACNWDGGVYEIPVNLQVGTVVDFVLDPRIANDWCDGTVYIVQVVRSLSGDVDGSGCVDDADLLAVLFAFGNTGSDASNADMNCDGVVEDADLLTVLFNFGRGC